MIFLHFSFLFIFLDGSTVSQEEIDIQNVYGNDILWSAAQAKALIESGKREKNWRNIGKLHYFAEFLTLVLGYENPKMRVEAEVVDFARGVTPGIDMAGNNQRWPGDTDGPGFPYITRFLGKKGK